MTKNNFSVQDTYELVDRRTAEIMLKVDSLGDRVGILENWRANLMGKLTLVVAIVGFLVSLFSGWVKEKLRI